MLSPQIFREVESEIVNGKQYWSCAHQLYQVMNTQQSVLDTTFDIDNHLPHVPDEKYLQTLVATGYSRSSEWNER